MHSRSALVVLITLASSVVEAQAPLYKVVDIGSLVGKATFATALNDQGQVVGYSVVADAPPHGGPRTHAFLYHDGLLTDLFPADNTGASVATAINEAGQVVGYRLWDPLGPGQPFVWELATGSRILNPFDALPVAATGASNGINDAGDIVGGATTKAFTGRGFRLAPPWVDGSATDLTPVLASPYFYSTAIAINNAGDVAWIQGKPGYHPATWDTTDSFLLSAGASLPTSLDSLLSERSFEPQAMSEAGQLVGFASGAAPPVQAYSYADGAMTLLAPLAPGAAARARGVNAAGEIVGAAGGEEGASRAVLWRSGSVYDLNDHVVGIAEAVLTDARAINDRGQVVASGYLSSSPGLPRSFLLSPTEPRGLISDLLAFILDLDLPHGIENSLTQKLSNAQGALAAGDTAGACDLLNALIHEVAAQSGKKIDAAAAAQVIAAATAIRTALGC